ncbi:MAG: hypothetical protein ACRCWG_02415 [Sarcina sp.]
MGNLIEKAFEKWYKFYKLINNKEIFNESDSIVAGLRIKIAREDYLYDRNELRDILESKGIIDNGISDRRISYIANDRLYIDSRVELEKGEKSNLEYNDYIYNAVTNIVLENIDIYFAYCENILADVEVENLKYGLDNFTENKNLAKKILKILYLFRNSEKEDTNIKEIEKFIKFSLVDLDDYFSVDKLSVTLEKLKEQELIYEEWTGNYSVISEDKKIFTKIMMMKYKEITLEEKNLYIYSIIKEKLEMIIEYIGVKNVNVNIDIDGEKVYVANSKFILKVDNYIKENRDIRRGYYVLNTKQHENIVFWYGKRILNLDDRIGYIIAEQKTIESLECVWKKDVQKMKLIKEQKEKYEKLLGEIKGDMEIGFKNGGYIYKGEDRKIVCENSVVEVFTEFINLFE